MDSSTGDNPSLLALEALTTNDIARNLKPTTIYFISHCNTKTYNTNNWSHDNI